MEDIKVKKAPRPGLYLVTLRNVESISVNAQDPRYALRAIKVNYTNCKFGKARDLPTRFKNYCKTFGEANVIFKELAELQDISVAEKAVLKALGEYRIRGATGRRNEWLANISPENVISIAEATLKTLEIKYLWLISDANNST